MGLEAVTGVVLATGFGIPVSVRFATGVVLVMTSGAVPVAMESVSCPVATKLVKLTEAALLAAAPVPTSSTPAESRDRAISYDPPRPAEDHPKIIVETS